MARPLRRAILAGVTASLALATFYGTTLTLVSGWAYTTSQVPRDAPYLALILPMFGAQVGAFAWLRAAHRARMAAGATTASGGLSGTAMVACCAHLLPTLLPYTGVAAFATVVTAWRVPMLLLAIASNVAGLAIATRAIRRMRTSPSKVIPTYPLHDPETNPTNAPLVKDPVCGMSVPAAPNTVQAIFAGKRYHFCSPECASKFQARPEHYATTQEAPI